MNADGVFTQIAQWRGVVPRVPIGDGPPLIELEIAEGAYILDLNWTVIGGRRRVTEDWHWRATVVHPLPEPSSA